MREDWQHGGFGLYIHWPFCQAKCPYCDFNSHVSDFIDQERWLKAYLSEIERVAAETPNRVLRSVFFGGGTPSLMDPKSVERTIDKIKMSWPIANDIEITLEANPTSIEAGRFQDFHHAGINRVSIGIQALNDGDLRRLGRMHTAAEGIQALEIANGIFDRVSFDLIYARQDQTISDWSSELSHALSIANDHISLYQLTIEDGTVFGRRFAKGQLVGLPDEDTAADMYFLTQDICSQAGLLPYEVSNHAKTGQESRHNLIYWRYGDYAGIGPGAHGRVTQSGLRHATETPLAPGKWLASVEDKSFAGFQRDHLATDEELSEFLLMGLRLSEGVLLSRLKSLGGDRVLENVKNLKNNDLIGLSDDTLFVTAKGRPLLNAVLRELLH